MEFFVGDSQYWIYAFKFCLEIKLIRIEIDHRKFCAIKYQHTYLYNGLCFNTAPHRHFHILIIPQWYE